MLLRGGLSRWCEVVEEARAAGVTWWRLEVVVRGGGGLSWWREVVQT